MSVLSEARQVAHDGGPIPDDLGIRLMEAARAVYLAGHSVKARQLNKSGELTPYIHLLTHPHLYPDADLLVERLELCVEMLEGCRQRPVLEAIGLTLLVLDFAHTWTTSHPHTLERILALDTGQSHHHTIPILALCMHHSEGFARDFAQRISQADLNPKKTRVGELIETIDIFPYDRPIEPFIELAYGAIFDQTLPSEKIELLRRVIKECLHKEMFERDERWTLLIDPIISQNLHNSPVVDMLSDLMEALPEQKAMRYLANYTMAMAQARRMLNTNMLDMLDVHATSALIPYLYPSTRLTERTLFGTSRKTPYAERVEQIIETIVEREQIDRNAGGLTLSEDGSSGGLTTVLEASYGTLSVEAPHAHSPPDPSELLPPIPITLATPSAYGEEPFSGQLNPKRVAMVIIFAVAFIVWCLYMWV